MFQRGDRVVDTTCMKWVEILKVMPDGERYFFRYIGDGSYKIRHDEDLVDMREVEDNE